MDDEEKIFGEALGHFGAQRFDEAQQLMRRLLERNPSHAASRYYLGVIAGLRGEYAEAIRLVKAGVEGGGPADAKACFNLAVLYHRVSGYGEARQWYRRAVELDPSFTAAVSNLADVEYLFGNLSEAEKLCRRAIEIDPDFYMAHNNLGNVLKDQGRYEESARSYRRTLELKPDYSPAFSNLLLCLCYDASLDFTTLCDHHKEFGRRFRPAPIDRPPPDTNQHRRLKIGFVSPDFRTHSVAYFVEPILRHLDRSSFEVYCYSDVTNPDPMTQRLRSFADHWREAWKHTDDRELARQIAGDRIDILVDLAGHSAHNRLVTFAMRPAPVQVTHIGYPVTTGLTTIDYRITDAWADPADEDEYYSEKLYRLDAGFLCYSPPRDAPPVREEPPVMRNGHVTFGSCNNMPKIGPAVVSLWAEVLKAVPGSKLMLKVKQLVDGAVRNRIEKQFSSCGVDPSRLILKGHAPTIDSHLASYNDVDIALDTIPYNGTTTTLEALWMGAPVVALEGRHHPGRVSHSILSRLGLSRLTAASTQTYVALAAFLAQDTARLSALRRSLRHAVASSSLCNAPDYAACLGEAYREMWRMYLAEKNANLSSAEIRKNIKPGGKRRNKSD